MFTSATLAAQKRLSSLQGVGAIWFCGAYFGFGFHEDGPQAGLAVAEEIGGVRRHGRSPAKAIGFIWAASGATQPLSL